MDLGDYDVVVGLCGSLQVALGCCGWFRLVVDGFWLVLGCSGWFRLVVMVLAGVVVGVFGWFWVFLAGCGWFGSFLILGCTQSWRSLKTFVGSTTKCLQILSAKLSRILSPSVVSENSSSTWQRRSSTTSKTFVWFLLLVDLADFDWE